MTTASSGGNPREKILKKLNKSTIRGFLILSRPANLPTAVADIWAGAAIAQGLPQVTGEITGLILLSLASIFLYASGVVLNDVFDASLDAIERPERPIPRGMVSRQAAFIYGLFLMSSGILSAFLQGPQSGILALFLSFSILLYNGYAKHLSFFGPLAMGICRGINLLLGMSIVAGFENWEYGAVPVIYIFAVTLVSRGEVHGDHKNQLLLAGLLYALAVSAVFYLNPVPWNSLQSAVLGGLILVLGYSIYNAYRKNTAPAIKQAVVTGVLGIVVLDAGIAAGYAPWIVVLIILLLLPLAMILKARFNVT